MTEISFLKLEIFLPETHLEALQTALQNVDAGHIGNYDCCLSYSRVMGTWRPLPGTSPYSGEEGVGAEGGGHDPRRAPAGDDPGDQGRPPLRGAGHQCDPAVGNRAVRSGDERG